MDESAMGFWSNRLDCANACYMIDQWLLLEYMWLVYYPYK
jgi:hypothetical protein